MPQVPKIPRVGLRIIGPTTDDRYLKTSATNHVLAELTPAAVLADIGAAASVHDHLEEDITDLQAYMLNLSDDTTPELSGDLALAATGVGFRSFEFDYGLTAVLTIENLGAGSAYLWVKGSMQVDANLIVLGDITVSGTVDGIDIAAHSHEGTTIKSIGEAGGTKFLREDGDGTCSWQSPVGGGGDIDMNGFNILFDNATGIHDDSDNEQLIFQKTASAVTYFEMTNATTGNGPTLGVAGETNVDLNILAKGTGIVTLGVAGNVGLFASVAYVFGPNQNKKAHLGSASKKWGTGHFGELLDCSETGVRGPFDAAAYSSPPTDAQLDTTFGQPAALGSGFKATIRNTTGGSEYIRTVVVTDELKWAYSSAFAEVA